MLQNVHHPAVPSDADPAEWPGSRKESSTPVCFRIHGMLLQPPDVLRFLLSSDLWHWQVLPAVLHILFPDQWIAAIPELPQLPYLRGMLCFPIFLFLPDTLPLTGSVCTEGLSPLCPVRYKMQSKELSPVFLGRCPGSVPYGLGFPWNTRYGIPEPQGRYGPCAHGVQMLLLLPLHICHKQHLCNGFFCIFHSDIPSPYLVRKFARRKDRLFLVLTFYS